MDSSAISSVSEQWASRSFFFLLLKNGCRKRKTLQQKWVFHHSSASCYIHFIFFFPHHFCQHKEYMFFLYEAGPEFLSFFCSHKPEWTSTMQMSQKKYESQLLESCDLTADSGETYFSGMIGAYLSSDARFTVKQYKDVLTHNCYYIMKSLYNVRVELFSNDRKHVRSQRGLRRKSGECDAVPKIKLKKVAN